MRWSWLINICIICNVSISHINLKLNICLGFFSFRFWSCERDAEFFERITKSFERDTKSFNSSNEILNLYRELLSLSSYQRLTSGILLVILNNSCERRDLVSLFRKFKLFAPQGLRKFVILF